jgi:hypothetical protein
VCPHCELLCNVLLLITTLVVESYHRVDIESAFRMVETITLELSGVKVVLISTGAAILSIHTPDRNGHLDDIVLGHPTVEEYSVRADLNAGREKGSSRIAVTVRHTQWCSSHSLAILPGLHAR